MQSACLLGHPPSQQRPAAVTRNSQRQEQPWPLLPEAVRDAGTKRGKTRVGRKGERHVKDFGGQAPQSLQGPGGWRPEKLQLKPMSVSSRIHVLQEVRFSYSDLQLFGGHPLWQAIHLTQLLLM